MLSTRWTILAYSMEINPLIIADIRRDMSHEGGTMYAIQTMLHAWVSKCGPSKATFAHLIKIVESLELNGVTGMEWIEGGKGYSNHMLISFMDGARCH